MTRGDEDIEGGLRKFLDTRKGGSEKIVGLGWGLRKFVQTDRHVYLESYTINSISTSFQITKNYNKLLIKS